jgi:hypothetical protein
VAGVDDRSLGLASAMVWSNHFSRSTPFFTITAALAIASRSAGVGS